VRTKEKQMNDVVRDEILSLSGAKPAWSQRDVVVAPVLGLYGGADGGISNESVDKMRAALKAAGKTLSESVTYPDTPHAFHADYRPTYRKEQADDGWKRLQEWFKKHL
jgi:carboxymethylenebutenolidase